MCRFAIQSERNFMIVEVNNLVKNYKTKKAVDGISFHIDEGEIFGLLGPNGAGKSTTINSILGLLKITDGKITILGENTTKSLKKVKSNVGYVPQDFAMFMQLSALDNVNYWAKIYGFRGEELKRRVQEALEFTGLWEQRKQIVSTFSGGMKRRLNIACGIVHKPKILFLDEPTAGVDPQSRNNILEAIRTLNKQGTTVLYTSHYMEEIEAICNRVAIMDYGKIIAEGTIDNLIDSHTKDNTIHLDLEKNYLNALDVIKQVKGVISVDQDNQKYVIKTAKDDGIFNSLMEQLMQNCIHIQVMEIKKPNLETVFLELTGKQLRE